MKTYELPESNRAYIEGYLSGKKADGLDWSLAEGRLLDEKAEKEKLAAEEADAKMLRKQPEGAQQPEGAHERKEEQKR